MLAMRSETTLKVRWKPMPAGEQSIRMAHNLPVELIVTQCDRGGRGGSIGWN